MKLCIIENWDEEGIRHASELGIGFVEFCYNVGNNPDDFIRLLPDIASWCEKYGVKVACVGRWGTDKLDGDGKPIAEELEASKKLIDCCKKLGSGVFNTGVNYVEKLSFLENCRLAADYLNTLCDYGEERGVKIAVYNCGWNNFITEPKSWSAVFALAPRVGIKYDASHCITARSGRYLEEINEWAQHFYHFHVKGTIKIGDDHVDDPPAGLDMIDWRQVMGLLYAKGYDGALSIEPHSSTWRGELGEWGVRLTVDYISKMIF